LCTGSITLVIFYYYQLVIVYDVHTRTRFSYMLRHTMLLFYTCLVYHFILARLVCLPNLYELASDSWWEAIFELDFVGVLTSWILPLPLSGIGVISREAFLLVGSRSENRDRFSVLV